MHNLHTKNRLHPRNALMGIAIIIRMAIIMDIHTDTDMDMGTIIMMSHPQKTKLLLNQQLQYNHQLQKLFFKSYLRVNKK